MFHWFKSKKLDFSQLKAISLSAIKDDYFYRTAAWAWLDDKIIYVIDPKQPRMITMDDWPQLIFLEAQGKKTVQDFVYELAKQYSSIPKDLDIYILEELEKLVQEGLVALSKEQVTLDTKLLEPRK